MRVFLLTLWNLSVLVCLLCIISDSESQLLRNACKINQFRCSDGSRCLPTEKLCDGKRDCPKGEDERGSAQWDCTKILLSQPCDARKEFRCRFGGCVPSEKICDGVPNCWGATDESTDTCSGGNRPAATSPPKVQTHQQTQRPKPPTPSSDPPRRRPPVVRPTFPPTQSPNTRPPQTSSEDGKCPPIIEDPLLGFEITCNNQFGKPLGNCASSNVPLGSTATYRCAKYYSLAGVGSSTTVRTCQENGQWTKRRQNFACSLECGVGGSESVSLVTGGIQSKKGKWPWHSALYHEDPPNSGRWDLKCGGSLITPQAILTAAHCVTKRGTEIPLTNYDIKVGLGKYTRSFKRQENGEQIRGVRHIEVHEDYNQNTLESDIGIIFLDKPALISDHVRPVCLPSEDMISEVHPDAIGNLVGWGRTTGGKFKEELQEATIPVVDTHTCKFAHPTFASLVRSTNFCAGYRNGTSACDGDSGGGLVFLDTDTRRHFNVHGIVSAGVAKNTGGCEDKYYAVFTRVARFHKWIENKLDIYYQP